MKKTTKNNNTGKHYTLLGLMALIFSFFFISCTKEELAITDPNLEDAMVRLTISTPGSSLPRMTRSGTTDNEYLVSDIKVLVFNEGSDSYKFQYMVEGQQITPDVSNANKTHFSARLKTSHSPIKLLLVANTGNFFDSYTPNINASEEEVIKKINVLFLGNAETVLPMFGQKELPFLDATEINTLTLMMLRAIARVDVEVNLDMQKSKPFVIESIHAYRTNKLVQVIPNKDVLNESGMKVSKPSVTPNPEKENPYHKTIIAGTADKIEKLYLSEAEHINDIATEYNKATCIVVGGKYNGEEHTTYYRIDFNSELEGHPSGQVLRNHKYLFRILQVNGSGWETPEEAANNRSTNIIAEIQEWEDFTMEMFVNGENYLGIASRDVIFNYKAELEKLVGIQSTVPYRIYWEDSNETTGVGGAIITNEHFSAQIITNLGDADDVSYILFTTLKENNSNQNITSKLKVEWGNWLFTVNVTQLHYTQNVLKSVRVLSFNAGATGALGNSAQNTANGATMRRFLSNVNNFSSSGTVNFFAGFSFSQTPNQTWLVQANGFGEGASNQSKEYSSWVTSEVYGADVIYLANDNYCTPWAANLIMGWLEESPHRVLIVGGDGNRTSPGFLLPEYQTTYAPKSKGLLVDDIDWWYNLGVVGSDNSQSIRTSGDYFKYLPNEDNKEFFNADSPFGVVNTSDKLKIVDVTFGYAKTIHNNDIIPLIGHSSGEQPILAINKKQRIIYFGDASIFEYGGDNMMSTAGVVTNSHDKFFCNLWTWIAHQVIWGDNQRIDN